MVNATKYKLKNAEKCLNNFFTKYPLFMEYLYPDYVAMYTELSKTTTLNDIELMETWLALVYPIMCLLEEDIKIVLDDFRDIERPNFENLFIGPFMPEYTYLLYAFCLSYNIKAMLYDMQDDRFQDKFTLLSLFKDVEQYDIVFFINADYYIAHFLIDYGIAQCVQYGVYIYLDEQSTDNLHIESPDKVNTSFMTSYNDYHIKYDLNDALYLRENKIGFDLYDNLREWKKEVTAPTRDDPEYRKMKKRVRQRDNNTCQCCGYHSDKKTHHNLEVHHIFGYKDHLDYRVEDSNCVVLCQDCHKKYHSLYGRKEVAPDTFMKFIRDYNNFHNESMQTTLEVYHA